MRTLALGTLLGDSFPFELDDEVNRRCVDTPRQAQR
jgi:hypothetical protein